MPTNSPPSIDALELRAAAPNDDQLLFEIYASSREIELTLTGWSAEQCAGFLQHQFLAQQTHYAKYFPAASNDIIMLAGEPVGRLWVDRTDAEINILDLIVLTAQRRQGIGGRILERLKEESTRSSLPLHISVEMGNPSLAYFQRLGFAAIKENGPHFTLEWKPLT